MSVRRNRSVTLLYCIARVHRVRDARANTKAPELIITTDKQIMRMNYIELHAQQLHAAWLDEATCGVQRGTGVSIAQHTSHSAIEQH